MYQEIELKLVAINVPVELHYERANAAEAHVCHDVQNTSWFLHALSFASSALVPQASSNGSVGKRSVLRASSWARQMRFGSPRNRT